MIANPMFPPMDKEDREVLLAALSIAEDQFMEDANRVAEMQAWGNTESRQSLEGKAKRAKSLRETILAIMADYPPLE